MSLSPAPSHTGQSRATRTAGMAGSGAMAMGSQAALLYLLKEVVAPLHASQVVLDGEEGQLPADPPPVRQRKRLALNGNASLKLAFGNFSILLAFFLDVPSRQQGAAGHI